MKQQAILATLGAVVLLTVMGNNYSRATESETAVPSEWHLWSWSQVLPASQFRCTVQWQCSTIDDVVLGDNQRIVQTGPTNTSGVCVSTGGGRCDSCAAEMPEEPCQIKIVTDE